MPKNYSLSPQATVDLEDIFIFGIENWDVKQAKTYAKQITECLELIAKNPNIGLLRPEISNEIMSFVVGSHIILYRKSKSTIEIATIIHQKMDVQQRFIK